MCAAVLKMLTEVRHSQTSAETRACFDGSAVPDTHDFDAILSIFSPFSCWFNAITLTRFTTSCSEEELHELVSSVVVCASASNDIKTDRQILVNTRAKLPDMLA